MELMAKYNNKSSIEYSNLLFDRFKISRNSMDSNSTTRVEVNGLRSDDLLVPVEVRESSAASTFVAYFISRLA